MNHYILAVDDNPDNLLLVKLALEQEGHRVEVLQDGAAALTKIEHAPPDLVLLDVMMPGMDGYEVTRRIRQHPNLPFIPILLITAYEEPSLIEGLDSGADEFIRKPVQLDELQARVRSLLRLKRTIDQRENFVSCLTHDLRTPLVAANRMLTLLGQGVFGQITPPMHEAFAGISSSNENLLAMLNTLLEVHCYEVGQKYLSFIPFHLPELLDEVNKELMPLAQEKDLDLQIKVEGIIEMIRGDRLELRRVIVNLISNAIKFTDSGWVKVRARAETIGASGVKRWLVLEIEDTGMGIAPEERTTIFERFRQGNHKRSGKGLGLYLCYQIIQAHQGTIDVQSQVGKGSLFTLRLPLNS